MPNETKSRASLAANLLLLAGTFIVFFIVMEVALRVTVAARKTVWGPEQARGHFGEYDSLLGWKNTPGARGSLETSEFRTSVFINSFGNRDPEMPAERTPGRARVAFLGDSFTWGYGVGDSATYSARLRALRPDVEFINLGMVGYGTDQELLRWGQVAERWKPDLLVIQFTQNDVGNNAMMADRDFPKPKFVLDADTLRLTNVPVPKKEQWLTKFTIEPERGHSTGAGGLRGAIAAAKNVLRNLQTYQFLQQRYFDLLVRLEIRRPGLFADAYTPADERDWKLTFALLDRIVSEARAAGIRVAVVTVPICLQIRYKSWTKPGDLVGKFCAERQIPYLDLLPPFREIPRAERLFFPKDGHWTEGGHDAAAKMIAGFLAREGLVPSSPAESGAGGATGTSGADAKE